MLLTLPTNNRRNRKVSKGTNTLAYLSAVIATKIKSFMTLGAGERQKD
jgi:hypothetical protein